MTHWLTMTHRRILLIAALVACSDGPSGPAALHLGGDAETYWPDVSWRSARPLDVDVDQTQIDALLDGLQRGGFGAVDALMIVRKGYVIVDTTFRGWNRDSIHTMQSVTKSMTSLATGIAIERGLIRLDESMTELLPAYAPFANDDARKRAITVRRSWPEEQPTRRTIRPPYSARCAPRCEPGERRSSARWPR